MIVTDANVLLNAVNEDAAQHEAARDWLDAQLSAGVERIAMPWICVLAFMRLSTRTGIFSSPLTAEQACDTVDDWVDRGGAMIVEPSSRHRTILRGLLVGSGTGGNLTSDAHVAAIAIEHGASVATFDRDFTRFAGLRVTLLS